MTDRPDNATAFLPRILDLQAEAWVSELVKMYADVSSVRVLEAVLTEALRLGAKSAILESDYIDRDYRSEYSAFYSAAFRQLPSVTDRIHFFSEPIPEAFKSDSEPATLEGLTYLGYVVLRPVRAAPVGRTMLAPTAAKRPHLTCVVKERVNLFGSEFAVEGFPFIAQDAHFGVCAHADVWMVARYHYLRFRDAPRITPAQLALGSRPHLPRPIVEAGVYLPEMREMIQSASLLPVTYDYKAGRTKLKAHELALRYLDSGIPVILADDGHVVTAVGYRRTHGRRQRIELLVHDDERGPYRQVGDLNVIYGEWEAMVVPLPEKVWIRADNAEARAAQAASIELRNTSAGRQLLEDIRSKKYYWRTVCLESNEFKSTIVARGASPQVAVHYQRMPMPRWLWLVELVDPNANDDGAVVGEVLWDSTNHLRGGDVLAWRLADQFAYQPSSVREAIPVAIDPESRLSIMRPKGRKR